ncbi:MOSC domain-containing protein [Trinickia dinghuensis]|uniref:MOSC domain-containing protein n=1 Tax=Trinickia dinghuensis TaxID=2291023 RepID=A0A3D8JTD3_9BURK|nr:MOSC N-terminal beta barrel domain-containing protein [Trinickia dinghuensis]RDU96308.1 MOSC domain-containing protein [Trinickia dinghuensis]
MPSISQLNVYPIKSCGAISRETVRLTPYGLEHDRNWMVIDGQGRFITQRTHASLALVQPALNGDALEVRAPGMATLMLPVDAGALAGAPAVAATVWGDTVSALDAGDEAGRWFSDFLGAPVRLARFSPGAERTASRKWTGDATAVVRFADGYPLLVLGEASLADLNTRLTGKGVEPIPMNRFRPNLVLSGIDAYEEDYTESFRITAEAGEVELRIVKPCTRCPMPNIDQARGAPDPRWPNEPTDTMSTYRSDSRVEGAVTFGQNAIVIAGVGHILAVGQPVDAELRFDA